MVTAVTNPRSTGVSTMTVAFNRPVSGVNLADFSLTLNGGANLLTAAQTLSTSDQQTYTIGNLAGLTAADGNYVLYLTAANSGIAHTSGTSRWPATPRIAGR